MKRMTTFALALCLAGCAEASGEDASTPGLGEGSPQTEPCGCNDCGCDVDPSTDIEAELTISLVGAGIYVGVGAPCLLELDGAFTAEVSAAARFSAATGTWEIVSVDAGSLAISTSDGCTCTGVAAAVIAGISVDASIAVGPASCDLLCDVAAEAEAVASCGGDAGCAAEVYAEAHLGCESTCAACAGDLIHAGANLDAGIGVSLGGVLALEALVGLELELGSFEIDDDGEPPH